MHRLTGISRQSFAKRILFLILLQRFAKFSGHTLIKLLARNVVSLGCYAGKIACTSDMEEFLLG